MEKEGQIWVSVITVCYTCRQVIEQTMRSVLEQNYPFVEYIVIDGASKDGTKEEIERLAPLKEKKFEYMAFPVAIFESEEGASSLNRLKVNREYAQIKGIDKTVIWKLKYVCKYVSVKLKEAFYASLPDSCVRKLREKNYERLRRRRLK